MLLLFLACFFSALSAASPSIAQRAAKVVVAPVQESVFVNRVEALGDLRPNARVAIMASVAEQVVRFHADDGARVQKGDVLVELRHGEEDARLEEAIATRDEALEALKDAEALFERGAGSESLLKQRRRDAAVAKARVKAAEAQLADRVLRAPFAGRIGINLVSPGATVEPGDQIMRLIDDHRLKIDFSVPNTFLSKLKVGAEIEARTRAWPGEVFRGRIRTVDAEADPVTRSVLVRALLPNEDGKLLPGLLMEVVLLLNERRALVVDEKALIPFGEKTFVMLVVEKDGKSRAERREVEIGMRRVGEVEILAGLKEGEVVVVDGAQKLRPGQEISPVPAKETSSGGPDARAAPSKLQDG